MNDVIQEFMTESREGLDRFDRELVALEAQPDNKELIARLFRVLHTVKGTAGFLGFTRVEKAAHAGETLLALVRDGKLTLDSAKTTALLGLSDALRDALTLIREGGSDGGLDPEPVVALIQKVQSSAPLPDSPAPAAPTAEAVLSSREEETAIRVPVELVDHLMNLTSELVLSRNQLQAYAGARNDPVLNPMVQQVHFLTLQIQAQVMKARLQPVSNVFRKFPRFVRDLAMETGKKVRVEISGEDTELDKSVLESLRDPLMHLVRNCFDHGIEEPAARRSAGKPEEGILRLSARHEAGLVQIEVSDDGKGLDLERIRRTILEKGLSPESAVSRMSDEEAIQYIFLPGFTTSSSVTRLSGRGVGMDVVRTNVERAGGSVEVRSRTSQGTSFHLRIPLTLSIVPALLVRCGNQRFALPRLHLQELVLLREDRRERIEHIHNAPVFRLRGQLLPVTFLNRELRIPEARGANDSIHLAILNLGDRLIGLAVDEILDFQEIVVKPLHQALKPLSIYSGTTLSRDGHVLLILDVIGLAQKAHLAAEEASPASSVIPSSTVPQAPENTEPVLLFATPDDGRMALSLQHVVRLEEIPRESIEWAGSLEVIQYNGAVLPLVRVSRVLPERRLEPRNPGGRLGEPDMARIHMVVYASGGKSVGLVVDRVLDILDARLEAQRPASRKGVLGSMIIRDRVTEILDIEEMVRSVGLDSTAQPSGRA
jgi:two-component system chemotaxis sensor kinase CheA